MKSDSDTNRLICIIGPTASGKTSLAVRFCEEYGGEILSADSRQVYKGMDIGTGKDLEEYRKVSYHLINIVEPGTEYNVFFYQNDFFNALENIRHKGKIPVLCGGTGMYIESVLKGYKLIPVPENKSLRKEMDTLSVAELERKLKTYRKLHNKTDSLIRERIIRAIEIEEFYKMFPDKEILLPRVDPLIIGIALERDLRRERITKRLKKRLENGLIEEVEKLLSSGIPADKLIFYGLEYRYLTLYLEGKIDYQEMFSSLNTAIHQFAKRQMTWFRKMEREGFVINWIDGAKDPDIIFDEIKSIVFG